MNTPVYIKKISQQNLKIVIIITPLKYDLYKINLYKQRKKKTIQGKAQK